jgi:hypothetical protein
MSYETMTPATLHAHPGKLYSWGPASRDGEVFQYEIDGLQIQVDTVEDERGRIRLNARVADPYNHPTSFNHLWTGYVAACEEWGFEPHDKDGHHLAFEYSHGCAVLWANAKTATTTN